LDDKVWKLYEDGITATLNQADTDVSTSMLKRYKPRNDKEMSAFVAAIRPGFASLVNIFLDREAYSTGVHEIDELLEPSEHFMLYQESIMSFLVFCGMKEDHTYDIIKKIAKKKFSDEEKEELKDELLEGFKNKLSTDEGFDEIWQVVDDAARYSFNAAHAVSVAYDSLYGAEAKAKNPLEYYTIVLNIHESNTEKTGKIIHELDYFGIKLENIKFGFSKSKHSFDKESNTIYKSISSIKFCNEQIADRLYQLSKDEKYEDFIQVIKDIKENKICDSRQLRILTTLNFFSDFGNNKKLLMIIELYESLYDRKQIKKDDIEKLGINEDLFADCYEKETEKLYKELNMERYIERASELIEDKKLSIKEQIKYELEYLEYITYINPKAPESMYYVAEMKFYKDKTKPIMVLYNLRDGTSLKTKITAGKKYIENPFEEGSVLNVKEFKERQKSKMINGSWVKTDEKERIVVEYEVY
jgi:DNA polymerase III alpha subunit